jgi:TldD protein
MAGWSRREVLAALAATGTAPGWAALLGCGGARRAPEAPAPVPLETAGELRALLRQVAADLAGRFRSVAVRGEIGELTRAVVEPEERRFDRRRRASVVLAGFDGATWFEQVTPDVTAEAIKAAAAALSARARGPGRAMKAAAPSDARGPRLRVDPRGRPAADWLERTVRLQERAAQMGGSRIVYRAATLEVDDSEVLLLGDGRDAAQRLVRTRARVLYLGWTGSALAAEEAAGAGALGLEAAELDQRELERAAEGALTLLTTGQLPRGELDLVLEPSVAALVVKGCARGFDADSWPRGRAASLEGRAAAAPSITLRDDPTAAGAYGGYRFDDEGWPARAATLIERGVVRGPLCDAAAAAALRRPRTGHGRRAGPLEPVEAHPSHLELAAGARTRDELIAAVDGTGYLVEGGLEGSGDPASWRLAVRARRAREIARGRLTGRVYGPVVVAGEAPALLGAVRALGEATEVHAWRVARGSGALATSVTAPGLVTRAWLGGEDSAA